MAEKAAELTELGGRYSALTKQYDEAVHRINLAKQVGAGSTARHQHSSMPRGCLGCQHQLHALACAARVWTLHVSCWLLPLLAACLSAGS